MDWNGQRVLVTGGAGFLGSHLCERLLARGQDVLCVDNFFTSSRRNFAHLLDNRRMELMRHDVTWPLSVEVDEIYNLACHASPVVVDMRNIYRAGDMRNRGFSYHSVGRG